MDILNNYKIIKELGHGMMGTVYMIEHTENKNKKNNKYALKIEKVEKKELKPNTKSEIWRELNFYKNLGKKYPEQFTQLIQYDFIEDCEHNQKYSFDIKLFSKQMQNKLIKKTESNYCIRKVFELVDGNLTDLIKKLEHKQIYSLIIQIVYAIKILHKHNYIHGDIHFGNIGWIKTNQKYIIINGLKIKTFGYIYKLIDFGLILSKSDISNKREKKIYNQLIERELVIIEHSLVDRKFWDWFNKNNIKYDFGNLLNDLKKTDEFEIIKKFTTNTNDQIFLYEIMFQDTYQKILCGNDYKKTIPIKLFLPVEDLLVMIKISQDSDLIIKYFYDKIC